MSSAKSGPSLSAVIPVYNSERILPQLVDRLIPALESTGRQFEVIFVEDCGPDRAWAVLQDLVAADDRIRAVQLSRNSGQAAATLCGLGVSRGDVAVTMDDDLQHPPEEIGRLLDFLDEQPDVDVVMAVPRKKQHAVGRRLGSAWMNSVNSYLLGKPRDLRLTGFRAMRRNVVNGLCALRVPSAAIGPLVLHVTRRVANLEFEHAARAQGRSNYTPMRLVRQILGNVVGFSMLPLRLLAVLGVIGTAGSVLLAVYLLTRYLVSGTGVPGWMSLALILTALFGFVFFAFGIVGEYLLRIAQSASGMSQTHVRAVIPSVESEGLPVPD